VNIGGPQPGCSDAEPGAASNIVPGFRRASSGLPVIPFDDVRTPMPDWISFWDSEHSIYVNAKHRQVHYRRIAGDIRAHVPKPDAVVLDYGCGEALFAEHVAAGAGRLVLCEAAPHVRETLASRYEGSPNIEVVAPEQLARMPDARFDMIVMHSVAQYMTAAELDAVLALFRRLVKRDGVVVLGDVIPPDTSAFTDAGALLGFAAAHGFFMAAVIGLARTALSSYWKLRSQLGLARYSEREAVDKLAAAGFSAKRAHYNIGHNPTRMTFLAKPIVDPTLA
jgi:SAM-dependent methyltransferase